MNDPTPTTPPTPPAAPPTTPPAAPTLDELLCQVRTAAMAEVPFQTWLHQLPDEVELGGRQVRVLERAHRDAADALRLARFVVRYTTAPVAYDGFGTVEAPAPPAPLRFRSNGKVLRKVLIDPRHLNWQDARYGSGTHPCFNDAEFAEIHAAGLLTSAS